MTQSRGGSFLIWAESGERKRPFFFLHQRKHALRVRLAFSNGSYLSPNERARSERVWGQSS